jgi:nitrogen fixation/metabolism regulation signal transduction histidine kinase
MQKNKDLPAMPVHPMQDKFGQVILMAGMTKLEITALNILSAQLRKKDISEFFEEDITYIINESYNIAEQFCAYLENKSEKESAIVTL